MSVPCHEEATTITQSTDGLHDMLPATASQVEDDDTAINGNALHQEFAVMRVCNEQTKDDGR
jgi:hypothetical protein